MTGHIYLSNMLDVQNVHVSQLMYRICQHYGRQSEHQELTKHRPKTT